MNPYSFLCYLNYLRSSKNAHALHSPFIYDLYTQVILNDENFYAFEKINEIRSKILKDETTIEFKEFGAGSRTLSGSKRVVSQIARNGITKEKYARLLFRIINHYKYKEIIEIGTSVGLTTLYLASPSSRAKIFSFEGNDSLINYAKNISITYGAENIEYIPGNFDISLLEFIEKSGPIDLIFFDGNHRKKPTLNYFELALKRKHNNSIFIFDDIYWSKEMTEAWSEIKANPEVTIAIDLFQFGLVFFRQENKIKEDLVLRF
ncbi:MAG: O-methyltransferase [Bacteroidota bacterium]